MNRKKILIFDDDKATLDVVCIICTDLGYEVETAETVDGIIERIAYFKPDLIMMDINIPTIGGINATALIRSHSSYSGTPVIFITAKNDVAMLSQMSHADGYLAKPFDIDALEGLVSKLI